MKPRDKLKLIQLHYDAKNPNANGIMVGDFEDIDKALNDGKKAITQRGHLKRIICDMFELLRHKNVDMTLFINCMACGLSSAKTNYNKHCGKGNELTDAEFKVIKDVADVYFFGDRYD